MFHAWIIIKFNGVFLPKKVYCTFKKISNQDVNLDFNVVFLTIQQVLWYNNKKKES